MHDLPRRHDDVDDQRYDHGLVARELFMRERDVGVERLVCADRARARSRPVAIESVLERVAAEQQASVTRAVVPVQHHMPRHVTARVQQPHSGREFRHVVERPRHRQRLRERKVVTVQHHLGAESFGHAPERPVHVRVRRRDPAHAAERCDRVECIVVVPRGALEGDVTMRSAQEISGLSDPGRAWRLDHHQARQRLGHPAPHARSHCVHRRETPAVRR